MGAGVWARLCTCVRVCITHVCVLVASRWYRFIRATAVCTSRQREVGSGCWTRFRFGYLATVLRGAGLLPSSVVSGRRCLSVVPPMAAAQAPGVTGVVVRWYPLLLSLFAGRRGAWPCSGAAVLPGPALQGLCDLKQNRRARWEHREPVLCCVRSPSACPLE